MKVFISCAAALFFRALHRIYLKGGPEAMPSIAVLEPVAFFAVTCTSSVWATSAEVATYVVPVAPGMAVQPPPVPTQRSHWYESEGAGLPLHEPGLTVSVDPSWGVPEMVGGEVSF